jgi:hypothetical protein
MSMRASFVAVAVVVGTVLFVVGCGQTSSSPTSPSSLVPSASSISDGRVTAYANGPLADAGSSVVHDPIGDSLSPAPYLDVVQAKVTEQQGQGTLFFMMVLAGPIPEEPSELNIWPFHLDTNPATAPGGLYNEYVIRVRFSGAFDRSGAFVGEVVNRTPLPGGPAIITPVPFSIDGRTVKVFVPLELLGNPSSFGWNAAARPGATVPYVDFAPDSGLATWTQ